MPIHTLFLPLIPPHPAHLSSSHLFDLTREVQDIARTLKSKEDALACRVCELEAIVSEWSDIFACPSSALIAAGVTRATSSPAALARQLLKLDAARADAEKRAAVAQVSSEREIADLRTALRDAGRVGREQAAHELSTLKHAADTAVARERAARAIADESLASTRATMAADVANEVRQNVVAATVDLRSAVNTARAEAATAIAAANKERDAALSRALHAEAACEEGRASAMAAAVKETAVIAAIQTQSNAKVAAAQSDALAAAHARDTLDAAWRERWTNTNSAWENSTSALRVSTLENQCAFLTARVRELQTLCDAMQAALAGAHGASSASAPGAEPVGPSVSSAGGSRSRGGANSRPWSKLSFGAFPGLVNHAGAAGDGLSFAAGPAPIATAYAWVR